MSPEDVTAEVPPVGLREVSAVLATLAMFLTAQLLAVMLRKPFHESGVDQAFEDPNDPLNGVWLLLTVILFTLVILYIARKKLKFLIQGLILGSVGLTLVYVFFPLLDYLPTTIFDDRLWSLGSLEFVLNPAVLVALVPAALLTWLLVKFPEWYIVDAVGIGVSAGAVAIFGASFTPVTYLIVLVAFAIYDFISVYRTKHMLALADSVLDMHLPILLVVPKSSDYSFLDERGRTRERAENPAVAKQPRDALFIGLGDIVIPSIFGITALSLGAGAAVGAFAGIAVGLLVLMAFVLRGRPHAGLPTLNAGAFLGFIVGFYLENQTVVFW